MSGLCDVEGRFADAHTLRPPALPCGVLRNMQSIKRSTKRFGVWAELASKLELANPTVFQLPKSLIKGQTLALLLSLLPVLVYCCITSSPVMTQLDNAVLHLPNSLMKVQTCGHSWLSGFVHVCCEP